jgi:hypothetical protein
MSKQLDTILSRLEKVKRTGHSSFMACCPAHKDRDPSLSITDNGDGRLLLKCFAGCETENVIGAIGLTWDDIMPERQKFEPYVQPSVPKIMASDALRAVRFEAQIVLAGAYALRDGKLPDEELKRLELAMERINTVLESVNG